MLPEEEVSELKMMFPGAQSATEGGFVYVLLPGVSLPEHCSREPVDLLFCPMARGDGYPSRLFFSRQVAARGPLNWNAQGVRILERNWWAYSWKINTPTPLRLAQTVAYHLSPLK